MEEKMKKSAIIISLFLVLLLVISGCTQEPADEEKLKVVVIINTNLGDKAFSDLVWSGVTRAAEDFDLEIRAIELGGDPTRQEPTLTEVSESGEWDLVVTGTFNLFQASAAAAKAFPEQKYLLYDVRLDFTDYAYPNAVSILSKQNEGSYLAGVMAAKLTQVTGDDKINDQKVIGFVGGGENAAINDFLIGYIAGAKSVDPEVKILFSYIGNFTDAAKAKELALAQYDQGADIVYAVAGSASYGVYEASALAKRYSIGVDQDRALQFEAEGNLEQANHIVTSVVKHLDILIYNKIKEFVEGTITYGVHQAAGLALNGMGLAKNKFYEQFVPADIRTAVDQAEAKIVSGEIVVPTAIGMSTEDVNIWKNRASE
jgi:basic membrane protein A and related proteins